MGASRNASKSSASLKASTIVFVVNIIIALLVVCQAEEPRPGDHQAVTLGL
jgi:hypothetical protein